MGGSETEGSQTSRRAREGARWSSGNRGLRLPVTAALTHPTINYHSRHDRSRKGRDRKEVLTDQVWRATSHIIGRKLGLLGA